VYALLIAGKFVFAAGAGKAVSVYDIDSGELQPLTLRLPYSVYAMHWIPQTDTLLIGNSGGGIHVVNMAERVEKRLLQFHRSGVYDLVPAGPLLLSGGGEGRLSLIQTADFELIKVLSISSAKLRRICFLPMLSVVAVGDSEGTITLVGLPDGEIVERFPANVGGVYSLCLHPNGQVLMSGGKDGFIRCWDISANFKEVLALPLHKGTIYDIRYNNGRFATVGRDKIVKIWSEDLSPIARLEARDGGHSHSVNRCLWVGENRLLSAGDDRRLLCWNLSEVSNS
jgi:WD40 repeat protein